MKGSLCTPWVESRVAFFGLGYLPWEVIWEPISVIRRGQEIPALAGALAEGLGRYGAHIVCDLGDGERRVVRRSLYRLPSDRMDDALATDEDTAMRLA